MTETTIIPVSYTLKKVKSIDDLRTALQGQCLVMYSKFEPYQELDARKKQMGNWTKLFILKFNEQNELVYWSTVAADFKWWSDIDKAFNERFTRYKSSSWGQDDYAKGEQQLFDLFLYNRKQANTMYIAPHFMPDDLKQNLQLMDKTARELIKGAQENCLNTASGKQSHRDTLNKRGQYNRIKDKAVAIRNSYPIHFIKYTFNKLPYTLRFDYSDQIKLTQDERRSGYDIRNACTYSQTFNQTNYDYTILTMKQRDVNTIHSMLDTANSLHLRIRSIFNKWLDSIPKPTVK